MSSTYFIFMTFTFEIIYFSKMLFEVVLFKIQILNHSKKSHENMTKMKVPDFDEFYNFDVYNIFIFDHLMS